MEALSSPRSNSSSPEDIAHSSERGASLSSELVSPTSSSGSTSRALASFRNVPKWGREILPLSIPETVVGLTPASSASLAWVHIRLSRMAATFLPAILLSMLDLSDSTIYTLTQICSQSPEKRKFMSRNCLQTVFRGVQYWRRRRGGFLAGAARRRRYVRWL